jgi:hypothetical protein
LGKVKIYLQAPNTVVDRIGTSGCKWIVVAVIKVDGYIGVLAPKITDQGK